MEPLVRGHPDKSRNPLERPLDTINLNINVLISTPDERPPILKGNFSGTKGLASKEGFHLMKKYSIICVEKKIAISFQVKCPLSVAGQSLAVERPTYLLQTDNGMCLDKIHS